MTDVERLAELVQSISFETVLAPVTDKSEHAWALFVKNVPGVRFIEVETSIQDKAASLWPEQALPVMIRVLTPEKTRALFP